MAKTWTLNPFTAKLDITGDSDIYVPYSGATTFVDLGSNALFTTGGVNSGYIAFGNSSQQARFGSGSSFGDITYTESTNTFLLRHFSAPFYSDAALTVTGLITANSGVTSKDTVKIKSGKKLIFDGAN